MCEVSSLVIFPWSRLLNAAYSTGNWGFARLYGVVLKFSPILKGPDVLPQRFPNFGKTNDLVFLTAKLSCYARYLWIKFHWEKNTSVRLSLACDGRIFFFHLTLFLLRETNLSSTFTKCLWFVPWVRLYWKFLCSNSREIFFFSFFWSKMVLWLTYGSISGLLVTGY